MSSEFHDPVYMAYENTLKSQSIELTDSQMNMYAEMAHNGDPVAKEVLYRAFYRYIIYQAGTFKSDAVSVTDMITHGILGLDKAIQMMDPKDTHAFRQYAINYIAGFMYRGFNREHNMIYVSGYTKSAAKRAIDEEGKDGHDLNIRYALFQNNMRVSVDENGRYDKREGRSGDDDGIYKELEDESYNVDTSAEELINRTLAKLPDDEYRYLVKASFGIMGELKRTKEELVAEGHRLSHIGKARMMFASKMRDDAKYRHLDTKSDGLGKTLKAHK